MSPGHPPTSSSLFLLFLLCPLFLTFSAVRPTPSNKHHHDAVMTLPPIMQLHPRTACFF
ncbi:hypothetical protein LY78DRAFT_662755 [Colletotrichum sublineola]|nr:hypothetical protein LY78DRAFT_662755 [Colletotrichum sublineola]